MIRCFYLCILLLFPGSIYPQNAGDTLTSGSFDYLYSMIERHADEQAALPYIEAYIKKAKQKKDWKELFNGYKYHIYETNENKRIQYADSMLFAAEMAGNKELIGYEYLTKGIIYYNLKNHAAALNNYILANRNIAATDNQYLKYKTKYNIGLIKYYLGYYNEALSLFRESALFFEEEEPYAYVNCLHNLGLTCNRLELFKESEEYSRQALKRAKDLEYGEIIPHLVLLQGVNSYYRKQHQIALRDIRASLQNLDPSEFGASAVGYFYSGKALWELDQKEQAISYFQKIDSIARQRKYIRPDLRQAYELLIDYYHTNGQLEEELHYIKRLLEVDKLMEAEFRYLAKKVHREYDTYSLTEAKNHIEKELEHKKSVQVISYVVIGLLVVLLSYAFYHDISLKKRYRKRFDELLLKKVPSPAPPKVPSGETLDINPEVAASILEKLEQFEQKRGFLRKDLTAPDLAKTFDTNYKYLSKVVHHYRNKSFTAYLNDLRIDYIVRELQDNPKLRHYTNVALAEEAGFSTAQHFTRAFGARVKIPPSFFVQQLRKQEMEQGKEQ